MPQTHKEDCLTFDFPDSWSVCRIGTTSFYKRHFQAFCTGCKEVDFALYDPKEKVLWFLEVKDYRVHQRTKLIDLADEIALKVRDSLALLRIAAVRDETSIGKTNLTAGEFAQQSAGALKLRVVLHCELPKQTSKLFPGVKENANLQDKLKRKLACVDPHPFVVDQYFTDSKCVWGVKTA